MNVGSVAAGAGGGDCEAGAGGVCDSRGGFGVGNALGRDGKSDGGGWWWERLSRWSPMLLPPTRRCPEGAGEGCSPLLLLYPGHLPLSASGHLHQPHRTSPVPRIVGAGTARAAVRYCLLDLVLGEACLGVVEAAAYFANCLPRTVCLVVTEALTYEASERFWGVRAEVVDALIPERERWDEGPSQSNHHLASLLLLAILAAFRILYLGLAEKYGERHA